MIKADPMQVLILKCIKKARAELQQEERNEEITS